MGIAETTRFAIARNREALALAGAVLLSVAFLSGCATASARLDDMEYRTEAELPALHALAFDVDGATIYGQILQPSPLHGANRPCAIICHGFAGFTRWDDVAHDLCRAGIAVIVPHHRGAWGSEGEYTVSGCIRDAEKLAAWAMSDGFAAKYGTAKDKVYIVGHSMGGNSAINAAARLAGVRGVVLLAPCEIGWLAGVKTKDEMTAFLTGEGLHVLKRRSDAAVIDDIYENSEAMRFAKTAGALKDRKVFLATGDYDTVVPPDPLDLFWQALGGESDLHIRKNYRASHSLLGLRRTVAQDLAKFILD